MREWRPGASPAASRDDDGVTYTPYGCVGEPAGATVAVGGGVTSVVDTESGGLLVLLLFLMVVSVAEGGGQGVGRQLAPSIPPTAIPCDHRTKVLVQGAPHPRPSPRCPGLHYTPTPAVLTLPPGLQQQQTTVSGNNWSRLQPLLTVSAHNNPSLWRTLLYLILLQLTNEYTA